MPISRLADCIAETQGSTSGVARCRSSCSATSATATSISCIDVDPASHAEIEEAEALNERLVARAIAMGGTSTGEHGIGIGKQAFLAAEHGEGAVATMRAVKRALDPKELMNPGKIFPS